MKDTPNSLIFDQWKNKTAGKYLKRTCLASSAPFSQQLKGEGQMSLNLGAFVTITPGGPREKIQPEVQQLPIEGLTVYTV